MHVPARADSRDQLRHPIRSGHQLASRVTRQKERKKTVRGRYGIRVACDQNDLTMKELVVPMRPKKIILCVNENEQELSVLKFMLATNGYRVVSANNGQEAIGIFADTPVDLVLSDFSMPQMNGDQMVRRLKQIASHIPMILLGDPQKMGDALHGADALLAKKNCSPQELLERIKVMSARKRGPRKGSTRMVQPQLAVAS